MSSSDLGLAEAIGMVAGKTAGVSRLGVVTAINTNSASLTVDINPGDPENPALLTGIRWFDTYTPSVDDLVGLIAIGSGWWVLGRNSYDMRQPPKAYGQVVISPSSVWSGSLLAHDDMWTWTAKSASSSALVGVENPEPGLTSQDLHHWALVQVTQPTDIPSGATIESGYLTVRAQKAAGSWEDFAGFYLGAHSHTSIPTAWPSFFDDEYVEASSIQAQPWTFQFPLPSSIAVALAAGTAKGIVLQPDYMYALASFGSFEITIDYSVPI